MMQVVEYTKKYVSDSTAHRRRSQVIEKMKEITSAGANCFSCSGVCCTFVGNSMMVTPIEAIELVHFLNEQGRWNNELLEKLNETILIYRLDRPVPSDGRRSFREGVIRVHFLQKVKTADVASGSDTSPLVV